MVKTKYDSIESVLDAVGVKDTSELAKSPQAQAKLIQLTAGVAPDVLKSLLRTVPDLAKAIHATISAMEGIGVSLEESKRLRWQVLQDLSKTGDMTGEQILEAIRLLHEIEKVESIDWTHVLTTALECVSGALTVAVFAAVWVLAAGQVGGRRN